MNPTKFKSVEYYICFCGTTVDHWVLNRLDPCFRHCYAVKKSPGGQFWIKIDPAQDVTEVEIFTVDKYPTIRALIGDDTALKIKSVFNGKKNFRLCLMSCVEVVKTLLGLDEPFILTPRQLYDYFIREEVT